MVKYFEILVISDGLFFSYSETLISSFQFKVINQEKYFSGKKFKPLNCL